MDNYILSNKIVPGAQSASTDAFTALGYGIEVALPEGCQNGDSWELSITPLQSNTHLGHTLLGGDIFVSNQEELLSVLRGNLLLTNNTTKGSFDHRDQSNIVPNFRTPILATYFNHIFLAVDRTLFWTDLDSYWNWWPATDSEADFRVIEWETENITALCELNETLYLHFPKAIYECVYTGKPTIVRILKRVTGAGSINHRSVIATKNAMFFLGPENFYLWSVDHGLQEIGKEIWNKFLKSSPDPMTTWAYHDQRNQEICWVNNGLVWAFNYVEGHWQKYSADGILSHTSTGWLKSFHQIGHECTCSSIEPDQLKGLENLWVGCWGIAREARLKDGVGARMAMATPYLETDDLTYGDVHAVKSTDLVVLDACVKEPWSGIRVLVAGKRRVQEKTVWKDGGVWVDDLAQTHRDFSEVAGRALRFRFEMVDKVLKADGSVSANGGQQLDGSRVDSLDGSIKLDGSMKVKDGNEVPEPDDGERWFAQLYAWGERVNLPEEIVGPDK